MEYFFVILLKASLSMALFYMIFLVFLKKDTFFRINRFYLLFALLLSLVLPVFPVYYNVAVQPGNKMKIFTHQADNFQSLSGIETGSKVPDIYTILLIVYLTGAVLFLSGLIIQTIPVLRLISKNKISIIDGLRIVKNEKYEFPFSFFRLIFINPKLQKQGDLNAILYHERVHVEQDHWIDLLIIELLTVIFWFNPFIWLFERSIKQNHEYLADQGVLCRGLAPVRYQALLINQLMGMQVVRVTNSLNFALNTNRLKMMTKIKSKKIRSVRFLFALPVLFLLMAAFAEPRYQVVRTETKPALQSPVLSSKETIVVNGVVKSEEGTPLTGASIILKGTTSGTVSDAMGKFSFEVPKTENTVLVASYVGFTSEEIKIPENYSEDVSEEFTLKRGQVLIDTKDADKILSMTPPPPAPAELKDKKNESTFVIVEEMPSYPGGHYALMKYYQGMRKQLREKLSSQGEKPEGTAMVGFTVDAKGKVTNIGILKKNNDNVAKAAVTMARNMKDWNPGHQRDKAVPVDFVMSFSFE